MGHKLESIQDFADISLDLKLRGLATTFRYFIRNFHKTCSPVMYQLRAHTAGASFHIAFTLQQRDTSLDVQ